MLEFNISVWSTFRPYVTCLFVPVKLKAKEVFKHPPCCCN